MQKVINRSTTYDELKPLFHQYSSFCENEKITFKELVKSNIPKVGGCYIIFDLDNTPIYVGRTLRLKDRFDTHHRKRSGSSTFRRKLKEKYHFATEENITKWIEDNCSLIYIEISSQREERRFEHFLIALLNPKLND